MRVEGFFDPAPVRQLWREHLAGTHNNQYYLWIFSIPGMAAGSSSSDSM
jgi:hypothetical protein